MRLFWSIVFFLPLELFSQRTGIEFENALSWEQVKSKAKDENKYIFVDVFATWCGPCKQMDREVYTDPKIAEHTKAKFISIKVQMDSTENDDEYIQSWYNTAQQMNKEFQFQGYPSFLFFDPGGNLIYRDVGYKSVPEFLILLNLVSDPNGMKYAEQLEAYRNGERSYSGMYDLAIFLKQAGKNNLLADSIAIEYKNAYLNKSGLEEMRKKENLDFMAEFIHVATPKDLFFNLCYDEPESVDRIENQTGWAKSKVEWIITNTELHQKLLSDKGPVTKNPEWQKISGMIKLKYPKVDAGKILLNYQVRYYRFFDTNWQKWVKYNSEKIKGNPPRAEGFGMYVELNVYGAWDAFLNCNDKQALRKTLDWVNVAIEADSANRAAYYDTKANILYKLGEIDNAVRFQTKAIELAGNETDRANLKKVRTLMQKHEPTYLWENAIWTKETLPRKDF